MAEKVVRTAKFTPGVFAICDWLIYGYCDNAASDQSKHDRESRTIWYNPRYRGGRMFRTVLHEATHAEWPRMSERVVKRIEMTAFRSVWSARQKGEDLRRPLEKALKQACPWMSVDARKAGARNIARLLCRLNYAKR